MLRLDRLRALAKTYPGVDREDEMVAAFDFCLHGKGGAAPSIDTAMHGLVAAPHVDHLHPDAGIALATAADGEARTRECFGDRVAWVPWRRPGFQLGLDIAALAADNPQAIGCVLGANAVLMDAYHTDVRPMLAELREGQGLDPDPMAAYLRSGHGDRIVAERVGGEQAGWERRR